MTTPRSKPAAAKPRPSKRWKALRAFSYPVKGEYVDIAVGETVSDLPSQIVKDLQTNHGDPVLEAVGN